MVSSTQINETLANLTGANKHQLDRNTLELRKAGIIESKGRGRSAAQMGFKEARDIMFAMLGANTPKEAPAAVKQLNKLIDEHGNTFGDVFVEAFKNHADAWYVTVSRSYPMAWITFFKKTEETYKTGKTEEYEHFFKDPDFKGEEPGLTINARLFVGVINATYQMVKASKEMEEAKDK